MRHLNEAAPVVGVGSAHRIEPFSDRRRVSPVRGGCSFRAARHSPLSHHEARRHRERDTREAEDGRAEETVWGWDRTWRTNGRRGLRETQTR